MELESVIFQREKEKAIERERERNSRLKEEKGKKGPLKKSVCLILEIWFCVVVFYFLFNDVYVHLCTGGPVEILKILRMFLNFKNLERASVSVRGERLKKKKSSVTDAEFGTAGVANVVLTRQQRSGNCEGDLFAVCEIRQCF